MVASRTSYIWRSVKSLVRVFYSTVEVFSTPPSPRSVHFNKDYIGYDKMAYDFEVMPYMFTVGGSSDVAELQGHHHETSDASDLVDKILLTLTDVQALAVYTDGLGLTSRLRSIPEFVKHSSENSHLAQTAPSSK